ncbi:MAG: hypothetical protein JW839_12315 [Candidatus Lokiarchaeota archaeon]|nr:hypothetical protein [Candidatus Lokiarchaeota archaeon]
MEIHAGTTESNTNSNALAFDEAPINLIYFHVVKGRGPRRRFADSFFQHTEPASTFPLFSGSLPYRRKHAMGVITKKFLKQKPNSRVVSRKEVRSTKNGVSMGKKAKAAKPAAAKPADKPAAAKPADKPAAAKPAAKPAPAAKGKKKK